MRNARLGANLGTGFDSCTTVQTFGVTLRWAWCSARIWGLVSDVLREAQCSARIWELVSIGIKKGSHLRDSL